MASISTSLFSPAATKFSPTLQFLLAPPSNACLLSLTTKRCKPNLQLFLVRVQSQDQSQQAILQPEASAQDAVQEEEEEQASKTRLLVQNVPWTCGADDIRPLFENHGTVVDIEVSMHSKTRNRGLVFVTMSSNDEAVAALNDLESKEFEGRVLKLNWAKPRKKKKPSAPPQLKPLPVHNLFVANLSFQANPKELKEFFNNNGGKAVSAEVIYQDNPRRPAGYGFVAFNTEADARAALATFEGKEFMGRPIRVARSKKFFRQKTKESIESKNAEVS